MPNNLDMGGFRSPGLPLRTGPSGAVVVETTTSPITPVKVNMVSAGAGAATLQDWQVGGASVCKIDKSGAPIITIAGRGANGWDSDGRSLYVNGGAIRYGYNYGGIWEFSSIAVNGYVHSVSGFYIGSGGNPSGADVYLVRDAAGTLNIRNSTTAQTLRVTRSYTDGSNYSWLTHKWNTTTAVIHAEGAGTGSDGSVAFNDAALATNATVGFLMIPSCAGTPSGTPADIPTGQIPIVWDSTNLKIYVYTGGAWKASAAFT